MIHLIGFHEWCVLFKFLNHIISVHGANFSFIFHVPILQNNLILVTVILEYIHLNIAIKYVSLALLLPAWSLN